MSEATATMLHLQIARQIRMIRSEMRIELMNKHGLPADDCQKLFAELTGLAQSLWPIPDDVGY